MVLRYLLPCNQKHGILMGSEGNGEKIVKKDPKDKGVRQALLPNPFLISGGAERDRTAGLQSAILALSQLSYCPGKCNKVTFYNELITNKNLTMN